MPDKADPFQPMIERIGESITRKLAEPGADPAAVGRALADDVAPLITLGPPPLRAAVKALAARMMEILE